MTHPTLSTTTTTTTTSSSSSSLSNAETTTTTTTTTTATSPVATATASSKRSTKNKTPYSALGPEKKKQYAAAARKKKELRFQKMTPEEKAAHIERERETKRDWYYSNKYRKAMKHLQRDLSCQNLKVAFGRSKLSASVFGKDQKMILIPQTVSAVYNAIGQSKTTGSHQGCYGECTAGSIQSAFVELVKMSLVIPGSTTMVELGAGMGKPALHWGALFNSLCVGVENDSNLFLSSLSNLKKVYKKARANNFPLPPVRFVEASIYNIETLNPFNVVYSFDSLFEPELVAKVAEILNNSSCQVFLSYRNMNEWLSHGLACVTLLHQVQMSMTVSKEKRTCYIYRLRNSSEAASDIIFSGTIDAYKKGKNVLTEENESIDVSMYCTKNMKTRSQNQK